MTDSETVVVLLDLMDSLAANGSWCGETHIQKATYFLQEVADMPLSFQFQLYKHGPYSFDLSSTLAGMRADELIDLVWRDRRYGPSLSNTQFGRKQKDRFSEIVERNHLVVRRISKIFGNRGVAELERLSTALLVTKQMEEGESEQNRASEILSLKPHVDFENAIKAVREVDSVLGHFH